MSLTAKRVIILLAVTFIIMAALALLLAIFQLAFYAQRGAAPASPAPPEARNSPRASPVIGQSPTSPRAPTANSLPAPPAGHETPENRDATRPVETVALIKPDALTIPVTGVRPEQS